MDHPDDSKIHPCTTGLRAHQQILLTTFNILLAISAFLGNVLIIAALRNATSLHSPSKFLFYCLASTDLCTGLIFQPIYINFLMSPDGSKRCYYLTLCSWPVGMIFCGVSLLTLTAISVDRLLALLLGLRYRHVVTLRRMRIVIIAFWVLGAIYAFLYLYNESITIILVSIILLICIFTSTISYTKIYLELRRHRTRVQHVRHQLNGGGIPLNIARYRKTVSSTLWLQMIQLACYLPFGIVIVAFNTALHRPSLYLAFNVSVSCGVLTSVLNPVLYCWKIREVRQAVKNIIRQFCP